MAGRGPRPAKKIIIQTRARTRVAAVGTRWGPALNSHSEPQFSWRSYAVSHVGKVRKLNEDACLDRPEVGLWAIADGMGGHSAGDLASQLVINVLSKIKPHAELSALVDFVEHGIISANTRLYDLAAASNQTIGSTVVTLLCAQGHCVYMWAGDSRLYRLRGGRLRQLTTDHSQVEIYVQQGLIRREDASAHPAGNLVTRAVGASGELHLDLDIERLAAGDRFLLCSDGLIRHVSFEEIETSLGEPSAELAAERLLGMTLSRGAVDNVSICVVEVV